MSTDSRYTAGGRARIVYDALEDEIFTARRYALRIRATENFFRHAGTKTSKLRLQSNGTVFNDLARPTHISTKFLSRDAMLVRYLLSRARGSASPVLTATGFVNGRWQFSTPPENPHALTDHQKIWYR